jgi:hypothetical protein
VPVLGVGSCILLLTRQDAKVWLFGAILLAVGAVLYALARMSTRRSASAAVHGGDPGRDVVDDG